MDNLNLVVEVRKHIQSAYPQEEDKNRVLLCEISEHIKELRCLEAILQSMQTRLKNTGRRLSAI